MNVGQNIRAIRKLQGITLEEVGNSLGVSKQFIAKLEQGLKTPNLSQLIDICEVLHSTPNDVLNVKFRKED